MRPRFTYGFGNGKYNYNADEILKREGDWTLRKAPSASSEWNSYIHHSVEKNIVQQNPWHNGQKPDPLTFLKRIGCEWSDIPVLRNYCTKCLNTIPDSLMGLWTLHNFDQIGAASRPWGGVS